MLRKVQISAVFLCLLQCGFTQPVLNSRYDLDMYATPFGSIVATDSCYYLLGTASELPDILHAGVSFSKIDLNGDLLLKTVFWNDSLTVLSSVNDVFIPTVDGNFAALVNANPHRYYFIKYDPTGDTVFTREVDYFQPDNMIVVRSTAVIQNEEDSSFTCLGWLQDTTDLSCCAALFNLSKNGDLNWSTYILAGGGGFKYFFPMKMVRHSDGGFLISGCLQNNVTDPNDEDIRYHIRLVKTDVSGNVETSQMYATNPYNLWGAGLTPTTDGGFLFCGSIGEYFSGPGGITYKGHLIKFNSDFTLDWERQIGYVWASQEVFELFEIIEVTDTTFVSVGRTSISGEGVAGNLIKFNLHGDLLWESSFQKIPWISGEELPEHVFRDVKKTLDNGFVMVGEAINFESTYEPIGQLGWVVKTDSFGCLVPNCQDVLALDPIVNPVTLRTYPNPAQNELNVFYHDNHFTSQAELVAVDLNGRELKRWKLSGNDMTYILEVAQLATGTYLLRLEDKGEVRLIEKFVKE